MCGVSPMFNCPLTSTHTMKDPNFTDEQRNADIMDAMADLAYEQEQAMRESMQSEWSLIEDDQGTFIGFTVINSEEYDDQA